MDFIHWVYYRRLVGVTFRGYAGSYRFTPVCSEKLAFYALAGRMGEIGLLLDGWDGRTRRNGWDGGGMETPELEGAG